MPQPAQDGDDTLGALGTLGDQVEGAATIEERVRTLQKGPALVVAAPNRIRHGEDTLEAGIFIVHGIRLVAVAKAVSAFPVPDRTADIRFPPFWTFAREWAAAVKVVEAVTIRPLHSPNIALSAPSLPFPHQASLPGRIGRRKPNLPLGPKRIRVQVR